VPGKEYYDRIYNGSWGSLTVLSLAIGQAKYYHSHTNGQYDRCHSQSGLFLYTACHKDIENDTIPSRFKERHLTGIDSIHFEPVIEGMEQAILGDYGSTARIARIPGIEVCGKTGTAQNPHGENHSIFVAFAPKHDPKIAIAVYVENAGYGSAWAAPIASLMIEKYLNRGHSRLHAYGLNKGC
jgi:penicillin-binding protein 2